MKAPRRGDRRSTDAVKRLIWLPRCCAQSRRGLTGIMNYTNPGAISHNEILELYRCYVDPEFKWANFSVEEQAKVIVAPRSNNLLDTARVGGVPSHPRPSLTAGPRVASCLAPCKPA